MRFTIPKSFTLIFLVALALTSRAVRAEERLTMPKFPLGWMEAFSHGGDQEIAEYVPPGQNATDWQRKITVEVYHNMKNLPLDALQRRAASQNRDTCAGVVEGKFQSGVNNGYPSAFWTLGCRRNKTSGMGETHYTKAIQGLSGLYVISQIWRTPPFDKDSPNIAQPEIEGAIAFLTSSTVCDADSKNSPCADGKSPAPKR